MYFLAFFVFWRLEWNSFSLEKTAAVSCRLDFLFLLKTYSTQHPQDQQNTGNSFSTTQCNPPQIYKKDTPRPNFTRRYSPPQINPERAKQAEDGAASETLGRLPKTLGGLPKNTKHSENPDKTQKQQKRNKTKKNRCKQDFRRLPSNRTLYPADVVLQTKIKMFQNSTEPNPTLFD